MLAINVKAKLGEDDTITHVSNFIARPTFELLV